MQEQYLRCRMTDCVIAFTTAMSLLAKITSFTLELGTSIMKCAEFVLTWTLVTKQIETNLVCARCSGHVQKRDWHHEASCATNS